MDVNYPEFFDAVPRIALRDSLSAFLGAFAGGWWSTATSMR